MLDFSPDSPILILEAQYVIPHQMDPGRCRRLDDLVSTLQGGGDRFLDQGLLSFMRRRQNRLKVISRGDDDTYDFNVFPRAEFFRIRVNVRNIVLT